MWRESRVIGRRCTIAKHIESSGHGNYHGDKKKVQHHDTVAACRIQYGGFRSCTRGMENKWKQIHRGPDVKLGYGKFKKRG